LILTCFKFPWVLKKKFKMALVNVFHLLMTMISSSFCTLNDYIRVLNNRLSYQFHTPFPYSNCFSS
ncbi:MAG: hypothetical protein M3Q77_02110, partial [Thermoproteota archaeon]|nr:hypothetical protein [Thermoproteota archaeon]